VSTATLDHDKVMAFVGKSIGDFGAMLNGALAVVGDRLGLYKAMADGVARTSAELAAETGTSERYLREWLAAQAGGGFVTYEGDGRYALPAEHALALTDESSPACVIGGFQLALASVHSTDRLTEAFRSGAGIGWGEHDQDLYPGCERFFGPSYRNFLTTSWIPALDGLEAKLAAGATVADVGCGRGASTLTMAAAYPNSRFVGFDAHPGSIEAARKHAADAGLTDRVSFEVATAQQFPGTYDLVTICDALHDMGDRPAPSRTSDRHSRPAAP
jgi:hypothetical protein